MSRRRIDLLVGSDIGRWIVSSVDPSDVGAVVSKDADIRKVALARGMPTLIDLPTRPLAHLALSAHWPVVLTKDQIDRYEHIWNIHPGLLPFGRGYGPVFWAIWAGEPAGATLHVLDLGLDKGPVVDQIEVDVLEDDTGGSLYGRVLKARMELFSRWWPRLSRGEVPSAVPQSGRGSYHARAELIHLRDEADLTDFSPDDIARLRRALTMPGAPPLREGGST